MAAAALAALAAGCATAPEAAPAIVTWSLDLVIVPSTLKGRLRQQGA